MMCFRNAERWRQQHQHKHKSFDAIIKSVSRTNTLTHAIANDFVSNLYIFSLCHLNSRTNLTSQTRTIPIRFPNGRNQRKEWRIKTENTDVRSNEHVYESSEHLVYDFWSPACWAFWFSKKMRLNNVLTKRDMFKWAIHKNCNSNGAERNNKKKIPRIDAFRRRHQSPVLNRFPFCSFRNGIDLVICQRRCDGFHSTFNSSVFLCDCERPIYTKMTWNELSFGRQWLNLTKLLKFIRSVSSMQINQMQNIIRIDSNTFFRCSVNIRLDLRW